MTKNRLEKIKTATKFSHPTSKKLCNLVEIAGMKYVEFLKILQELPNSCEICLKFKRTEPRSIVEFSLETFFNESITMDIKEINGNKVLHLIDYGKAALHTHLHTSFHYQTTD